MSLMPKGAFARIVDAAQRQFLTHGFRGVTMDDLAEQLGMSKKTLYAHFTSKTALVEAVLLAKFHKIEAELTAIAAECPSDFVTGLRRLLACLQRHMAEVQPPFLRDVGRDAPEAFRLIEHRRREVIQRHFSTLLTAGRREGLIRKDISIPVMLEILLGTVQMIMNPPKLAELDLTAQAGMTAILAVVLEGLLTPEGRLRV